jgi:hypothetical protein
MAKDWPSKQPAPQKRDSTAATQDEGGVPVTGFTEAPRVGLAPTGPGEGIPPSNKKIK